MFFSKDNSYKNCSIFKYNFSNLTDLYNYLNSNPEINHLIFRTPASLKHDRTFSGVPLETSIQYLKGGYNINFEKFDIATRDIRKLGIEDVDSRKLERSLHGGIYLSHLVAAGVPDCMVRYKRDTEPKHISIYFQLGYPHFTSADAIFNRGIATINLIQSLEDKGYIVDLKVFELSNCEDEYVDITVNLKNPDELLNISKCYYPFVSKEFLRRILFRVLECTPVTSYWGSGYGVAAGTDEIKDFYKLKDRDLIIPPPIEIGMKGNDVFQDTITLFEYLNLEDEFDLSKMKQKVKRK